MAWKVGPVWCRTWSDFDGSWSVTKRLVRLNLFLVRYRAGVFRKRAMLVRGRLFLVRCFSNDIKLPLSGTVIYENSQKKERIECV
ncbi:hypothetical protein C6I21_03945 [Alkalicoccus urumqiensis]|uniref:Uncharacterized protein n=1 Tax=Alkalicoccus urumqiensis TaxID=1548213 RepID=A0A2P6MJN7_ALKUR|nr:hypothetical protein C6I21_03945 [Alkalicoccus urumqiensis]